MNAETTTQSVMTEGDTGERSKSRLAMVQAAIKMAEAGWERTLHLAKVFEMYYPSQIKLRRARLAELNAQLEAERQFKALSNDFLRRAGNGHGA